MIKIFKIFKIYFWIYDYKLGFTDVKVKEKKKIEEELTLEIQERCRVEHDNLLNCHARVSQIMLTWRRKSGIEKRNLIKHIRKKEELKY